MFMPRKVLEEKLRQILAEDIGQGDITTAAVVHSGLTTEAVVIVKEAGIAAGVEETVILAESLGLKVKTEVVDGEEIKNKQVIMKISGDAQTILSAERTMLNLLSRMSGIATATKKLAEKLRNSGLKTKIACTRKTAPGLLYFDKKAVQIGGGDTHRLHLDDLILIKDNHIVAVGGVAKAIEMAKKHASLSKKIEVEVTKVKDAIIAAEGGADIVMLDNFSVVQIKRVVALLKKKGIYGKVLLEASGRISEENLVKFGSTGVDLISLGELTDSPKALDISLEIVESM